MRLNIFFIFLIIVVGCSSEYDKFQGHWHCVSIPGANYTLDIIDSTVISNKYNRHGIYEKSKLILYKGNYYVPYAFLWMKGGIKLKGDTLISTTFDLRDTIDFKWVKSKPTLECIVKECNANLLVDIKLDIENNSVNQDSILKDCKYCFINIGYAKLWDKCNYPKDSVVMQLCSFYAPFTDLKEFITAMRETAELSENSHLDVIINAHNDTPQKMLDTVINRCKRMSYPLKFYKTCINKRNKYVGVTQIITPYVLN